MNFRLVEELGRHGEQLGSFVTTLAFPYLLDSTSTHVTFFYVAAALNW